MNSFPSEAQQRERIPTEIHPSADAACKELAVQVADQIREHAQQGRGFVLGLATGSTPVRFYRELVRMHREEGLSFRTVTTFNLDEYHGLQPGHPESYWRFMHEQLFNHIDIPAGQIHIPDGRVPRSELFEWCRAYEQSIEKAGGLDLQILGIGRTGHIGFNEPGSTRQSRTRLVTLDALTRRDAARDFHGVDKVPRTAVTMGIGTIFDARRVVLLAWGEAKAGVVAKAVEALPSEALPASLLQAHPSVRFVVDPAAASELTRVRHPWLVGPVQWTPRLVRKAVTWLSLDTGRSLLKLQDEQYAEHGMAELITEQGPAYDLNIRVFNQTQHSITGWPGGKPFADDSSRPERASPHPKRVLVLVPEPGDELLGMGGTLARLVAQGHELTIAYLSSGSLAVSDEEASAATDLVLGFLGNSQSAESARARRVKVRLSTGFTDLQANDADVRAIKALLRRGETMASLGVLGLKGASMRFLDLPFYEEGRYRQFRRDARDLAKVLGLISEVQPHQIFTTGAAQDPSSVGAVCFEIVKEALGALASEAWYGECRVWLYRSPEKSWAPHEIEMAVPLSPDQLQQKTQAIYQHKTQRSQNPVRGDSGGEAWQVAEAAARGLAELHKRLGLADYEGIEAFSRWPGTG